MEIFFRVDSGDYIGIGHLMRCINLANYITNTLLVNNISFICKNYNLNCSHLIPKKYKVYEIKNEDESQDIKDCIKIIGKCDLLIIDNYDICYKWESKMRPYCNKIIVIDDICNRKHNCDILIDQNMIGKNMYSIKNFVNKNTICLLGPKYIILNNLFLKEKPKIIKKLERIHIFFGGSDHYNMTNSILCVLIKKYPELIYDIVLSSANQHSKSIKCKYNIYENINIFENIKNMANLINQADICIGSTGTSTYERLYLGKPSIVYTFADNQLYIANEYNKLGAVEHFGHYDNFNSKILVNKIQDWIDHPNKIINISEKIKKIVDGHGCDRIINKFQYIL